MEKKYILVGATAIIILLIDQFSKFLIKSKLVLGQKIPLIDNFFQLNFIQNYGAGFGILQQQKLILVFISIIVIGFILYYLDKVGNKEIKLQLFLGFVLGGTVGNLIDRIAYGYVIDFLDFMIWPVFNFADSFVTVGVVGLVIYLWDK